MLHFKSHLSLYEAMKQATRTQRQNPRVLSGRLHHQPLDAMEYQLDLPLLDIFQQYRSQRQLLSILLQY
ncbi:hypothetical protein PR003_g26932 [Phytophthora rubi]|uniref:Uncharacterized protein n=1 Tax=Phytophthora rubi TaxID=129364 RepID=A0A6A4C800_9STRA|nr:hypothetical protein PR003_g26932 [Phytophthora rubi]